MRAFAISLLIAGAVALVTGNAVGDVDPGLDIPRAAFAETDLNGDHQIDIGEFHARLVEVFYNADTSKDGFLDNSELSKLPFPETVVQIDRDADGKISLREFVRIRFQQFGQADSNDDAELSVEEVTTVYQGRKAP